MIKMTFYRDGEYVYINNPDGTTKRMTITEFEAMLNGTDEYVRVDPTLTQSGQAADAKVTGDEISDLKEDFDEISENIHSENYFDKANATATTYQGTPILVSPKVVVDEGDTFYYFYNASNPTNITPSSLFGVYQYDSNGTRTMSSMWIHEYIVPSGVVQVEFISAQPTAQYIMVRRGVNKAYYDDYSERNIAYDAKAREDIKAVAIMNNIPVLLDWNNIIYFPATSSWTYTPSRIGLQSAFIPEKNVKISAKDGYAFSVSKWSAEDLTSSNYVSQTGWIPAGTQYNISAGEIVTFNIKKTDESAIDASECDALRIETNVDGLTSAVSDLQTIEENSYNSAFHRNNYWKAKAQEFSALIGDSAESESFLFFTDPHLCEGSNWEDEFKEMMGQIQQCYNNTPTSFCLDGGDWLGNSDTVAEARYKLGLINGHMKSMFDRHYDLVGNHDTNGQGVERLSNNCLHNLWFRDYENCYYSFEGQNTKFYCFNTGDEGDILTTGDNYGWNMCKWFAQSLLTDNSEHIALAMHIVYGNSSYTVSAIPTIIFKVAKAYNERTVTDVYDTSYDFSSATGKIEFAIAGHLHSDYNSIVNDIPVIVTTNVQHDTAVGASFDLVHVDYDNSVIRLVRVGSGSDRTVNLT